MCSGIDIDSGLIAKANASALAASVDSRCSFTTQDALALAPTSEKSSEGIGSTSSEITSSSASDDHRDKGGAEREAQQWAVVQAADAALWPSDGARPISVVVRNC